MTATLEAKPAIKFEVIATSALNENPHNYRKTCNARADEELAKSVAEKGVLQPLLVRPIDGKRGRFEVVFGNRRLRAAKTAGLEAVHCQIQDLTDLQALEAALIENVQRVDVHPIEEAEGFAELVEKHKYSVADIVAKTGRSDSWVRSRLKLAEVLPAVRKSCIAGKISPGAAMHIARLVPAELQAEALGQVESWSKYRELSDDAVRTGLLQEYSRELSRAPWKLDDATVADGCVACSTCPQRSKNDRQLFDEVAKKDVCLDGACWAKKLEAHKATAIAAAQATGRTVLEGKVAQKAIQDHHKFCHANSQVETSNGWRLVGAAAKKGKIAPVLAIDDRGELVELYERKELNKLAPKRKQPAGGRGRMNTYRAAEKRAAENRKRKNRGLQLAAEAACAKLTEAGGLHKIDEKFRAAIWRSAIGRFWSDHQRLASQRRGLSGKGTDKHVSLGRDKIGTWMKSASALELEGLLLELVIYKEGGGFEYGDKSFDLQKLLASALGVSVSKCQLAAQRELTPKAAPAPKKKTKAKKR